MTDDPTRIRNQPALTTSTGRIWLIVGALFVGVCLLVLIPMTALEPRGIALAAVIVDAALYAGMVLARLLVGPGRRRLAVMAVAMLTMAAVSLVAVFIVAASTG